MYKAILDARTLETYLKLHSGSEFCTYADVQAVTGMSYKQARKRIRPALEPIPHIKPHKYLARHVAQIIANNKMTA